MSRTRLRQSEQLESSFTYDDTLNQGDSSGVTTEGQPSALVGANNAVVSTTSSTIVVGQNLVILGVNSDDEVTIAGSTSNDGTYIITSLSYSSPNTTLTVNPITLDGSTTLSAGGASGTAQVQVDSTKNLERDLNHIRTQLKKLNKKPNWFDDPADLPVDMFSYSTSIAIASGTPTDVGGDYDAGTPYDLSVYLNGDLLLPSEILGNTIVTQNDYQELKSDDSLAESGDIGRKVEFNFNIVSGDIIRFDWSR
jgi:hypothetical protein